MVGMRKSSNSRDRTRGHPHLDANQTDDATVSDDRFVPRADSRSHKAYSGEPTSADELSLGRAAPADGREGAHGIHHAGKLGEQPVPRRIDLSAPGIRSYNTDFLNG